MSYLMKFVWSFVIAIRRVVIWQSVVTLFMNEIYAVSIYTRIRITSTWEKMEEFTRVTSA